MGRGKCGFNSLQGQLDSDYGLQWEKIMGRPSLPENRLARREGFNTAFTALSAQLPQTDPGIETSKKAMKLCLDDCVVNIDLQMTSKFLPK